MARLQEADSEWGYLLKLQAERARQEEVELKQEEEMRKRKYKEQLEEMIAVTNNRSKTNRAEDAEIMKIMVKNSQAQIQNERQHSYRLQQQKVDFARENLRTKEDHIRRQIQDRMRENKMLSENYQSQLAELQQSRQMEHQLKSRQKTELASAYEHKIQQNAYGKLRLKEDDVLIAEESRRIEHTKDRQRKELLDKIKYGYHQNPQTFQTYQDILKKKGEDKMNVISKYFRDDQQDYDTLEKELFTKNRSSSSTGHGSRASSGNMMQIQRDLDVVKKKSLDPNISEEDLDRLRLLEKKIEFRKALQQQIEVRNQQKLDEKRMDNTEVRLNKQAFVGQLLLPGLSTNDYNRQKQRDIINNSMGVRARLRTLQDNSHHDQM